MMEQKPVAFIHGEWFGKREIKKSVLYSHALDVPVGTLLFTADQLKEEREEAITENQHLINIGKLVLEKFVSGNTIPVSRCVITADEVALLSTNESKENEVKG